jgi:hypothetical protein
MNSSALTLTSHMHTTKWPPKPCFKPLNLTPHLNVVIEIPWGALGDEQQRLELNIALGLEVDAV